KPSGGAPRHCAHQPSASAPRGIRLDPRRTFYTHISDQYAPFHTKLVGVVFCFLLTGDCDTSPSGIQIVRTEHYGIIPCLAERKFVSRYNSRASSLGAPADGFDS